MTQDERLDELAMETEVRILGLRERDEVAKRIMAALREAHALGRDEERERCARICNDPDGPQESGCCEAVLREATKAIEEGKG